MKVYVLSVKSLTKYIIALIAISAAVLVYTSYSGDRDVFSPVHDLPIYSVDCPEKKVSITFDCAWGADDIADILNTLKQEDVKATFFLQGQWAEKFPQSVKQISDEGHDVANHSYSHPKMGSIDRGKMISEISMCDKVLSGITGGKINLFRAPYGDYNDSVVDAARSLGYYTIQWDVDSLDWKPGITQQEIMNRVMGKVRNGSIILFHNDTPHTAKMLPTIITALKSKGYGFLPVSEMIMKDNYIIDFEGRQKKKE